MNVLNKFFDKIFCITVPGELDRQIRCNEQFVKYEIDFQYIPAVNSSFLKPLDITGSVKVSLPDFSLNLAHKTCIEMAKLHGLNSICILEDDFVLNEGWEDNFEKFTKELPVDWKMLYLGQAEWTRGTIYDSYGIKCSENVMICKFGCGSHFMGFNKNIFNECINQINLCDCPIDVCYNRIMVDINECYTPYLSLADAISMPHKKFHDKIQNFKMEDYIPSLIRDYSLQP
jgi:hypothetical protein